MFVQEIPKGYNPNVYFSSSINVSKKPTTFDAPAAPVSQLTTLEVAESQPETGSESPAPTGHQRGKRATGVVNYNLSQLSIQSTTTYVQQTSQTTLALLEERKSSKRFQELDRENYSTGDGKAFEIPKNGFQFYHRATGGGIAKTNPTLPAKTRLGVTPNTKRILSSRKNLSNAVDELDDRTIGLIFNLEAYEDKRRTKRNLIKLCSICGNNASMKCVRCLVRFCCLKCSRIHADTKCTSYGM